MNFSSKINFKSLTLIGNEPVNLNEVKAFLRVSNNNEDESLQKLLTSARFAAENFMRLSLIRKNCQISIKNFSNYELSLTSGPVNHISKIISYDVYKRQKVISKDFYHLDADLDMVIFATHLISPKLIVEYVSGFDNENCPSDIKLGLLMHIAAIYENRLGNITIPKASLSLYSPYRIIGL
jgi:uncharacterized phiE125 gp8 family phage protein